MRVLVANNEETNRNLLLRQLSIIVEGVEVTTAKNGQQALDKIAREGPFDLLVTDNNMGAGQLTGQDVIFHASQGGMLPPKVILMTGQPSDGLERFCEGIGAVLLQKPFELAELQAAIELAGGDNHAPLVDST